MFPVAVLASGLVALESSGRTSVPLPSGVVALLSAKSITETMKASWIEMLCSSATCTRILKNGSVLVVEDLGRTQGSVGIEAEAVVMLGAGSVCQAVGEGGVGIRVVGRELPDEGPNRLVLGNRKRSGGVQVGGGVLDVTVKLRSKDALCSSRTWTRNGVKKVAARTIARVNRWFRVVKIAPTQLGLLH